MIRGSRAVSQVPPPSQHGGDGPAIERALGFSLGSMLDLSATLNPFAPDVAGLAAPKLANALSRYPDARFACDALSESLGASKGTVLLTNGGAEAIALVAQDLGSALVVDPEFSLWRRHLAYIDPSRGRVRSNPHSPTGELAAPDEVALCWDEAFYPLSTGHWTRGDFANGAYVVGSLTKLYACPGLRLGYVIAPDEQTAIRLGKRQPQWAVNGVAVSLLADLLAATELQRWADDLSMLRRQLESLLQGQGMSVTCGEAPWVLVHNAGGLREELAVNGVVVRDCANFGMPNTVRIAVPGPHGLQRLERALGTLSDAQLAASHEGGTSEI